MLGLWLRFQMQKKTSPHQDYAVSSRQLRVANQSIRTLLMQSEDQHPCRLSPDAVPWCLADVHFPALA